MGGLFSSSKPIEPEELSEDPAEKKPEEIQDDAGQKTEKILSVDQFTLHVLANLNENTSTFERGDSGNFFNAVMNQLANNYDLHNLSHEELNKATARLLSECARHPSQILCRGLGSYSEGDPCCFSHIFSQYINQPERWTSECDTFTQRLAKQLSQKASEDLDCKAVVKMINQAGGAEPNTEFKEAMEWLQASLELVFEGKREQVKEEWAKLVCDAADAYKKRHKGSRQFRPVQLAAILLYIRGFMDSVRPTLGQMQTGEGKTDVCAAIAAVLARLHPNAAVHIITSSSDRASDDRKSTMEFFKEFLGEGRLPGLASEKLEWGNAGCGVFYAQITDIQKMVVNEIKSGHRLKEMYDWFKTSYAVIDECDHVLIEQATNQLYMSGPCPSFQELDPTIFLCQRLMDFDADFARKEVQTHGAVRDKAPKLVEKAAKFISDFERRIADGENGRWPSYAPHKVDTQSALQRFGSSCLSARLKNSDEEYILENELEGGAPKRKVTIMDQSTGTESKASRWTHEAPFLEAIHGIPVDGVEPLAYFNSIVVMVQKYLKFAGVTGTLGQKHCRKFYDDIYGYPTSFRFPRNRISCLFQLSPQIAYNQDQWLRNIEASFENYLEGKLATSGMYGFPKLTGTNVNITGPVLIIVNSVAKAKVVVNYLKVARHKIMMAESTANQEDNGHSSAKPNASCIGSVEGDCGEATSVRWKIQNGGAANRNGYHVFPYYMAEHRLPDEAPDCAIFVASNKGGRGLDIKLDGPCPEGCAVCEVRRSMSKERSAAGSVLFVLLTDIMSDRQDRQAVGRCGRGAKPGIFQYQILKETTEDSEEPKPLFEKTNEFADPKILKETTKESADPSKQADFQKTFDLFPDDMRIIQDQLTKLSSEAGQMQQKSIAIKEARDANRVMDDFALWKPGYVKKWIAKVFDEPKLSFPLHSEPQVQGAQRQSLNVGDETSDLSDLVRASILQFLDAVVENRWKCWRACGPPEREQEHTLNQFKQHQCLCDPESLAQPEIDQKIAGQFEQFASRLSCLADKLLLDAELILELGTTLIKLGNHPPIMIFRSLGYEFLKTASAKHEDWKLHHQKTWQPEWTGTASLLLASLATHLRRPDYIETAQNALDDAASRVQEEIERYQEISNVEDKFLDVQSDSPERKAFYAVQVSERINQLKHRKKQLNEAKSNIVDGLKIKHQSEFNNVETARGFKFMGPLWAKTVFAWGIDGFPLLGDPVAQIQNGGAWCQWIAGQETEGPSNLHSSTGGGSASGPNQEIKTEAGNYEAEKEIASVINAMEAGAKEQSTGAVAMPKISINYATKSHSISRTYSSEKSTVLEMMPTVVRTACDRVKNGIELSGRAKELLVILCEQVRAAVRMWTERLTGEKYKYEWEQEFVDSSQNDINRMEDIAYSKNVQANNKFSNKDVAGDVKHEGKGFKDHDMNQVMEEAKQIGSERINARDDSLSEKDQYLNAQALMALIQQGKQGSVSVQFRDSTERLRNLLSHWNSRLQAAAERGNSADWTREEAEEMNQFFFKLQRRARNFMLRAQAKGNTKITENFKEAYNNWKAVSNDSWLSWLTKLHNWLFTELHKWLFKLEQHTGISFSWPSKWLSTLQQLTGICFSWLSKLFDWQRRRAEEDIERYVKWGDCNKFNAVKIGEFNNMVIIDGVAQENGVHRQRLRRRNALREVSVAGWFVLVLHKVGVVLNPTLIAGLDSSATDSELKKMEENGTLADFERLQHLQDRANKDYYENHKQWMTKFSWGAIGLGMVLAICSLINPLFFAAAICIVEVTLAVLALLSSIVSAVVMATQHKIEKDETLTQEQKEIWIARLSIINSAAVIVTTIVTLGLRGIMQRMVNIAKKGVDSAMTSRLVILKNIMNALQWLLALISIRAWFQKIDSGLKLIGFTGRMNMGSEVLHHVGLFLNYISDFFSYASIVKFASSFQLAGLKYISDFLSHAKHATSFKVSGLSFLRDLFKLFTQRQQQLQSSDKQQEKEKEEKDESEFLTYQDRISAFTAELPAGSKLTRLEAEMHIEAKGKPTSQSWFSSRERQKTKSVFNQGKSRIYEWIDSSGKLFKFSMDLVKGDIRLLSDSPMPLQLQRLLLQAFGHKEGERFKEVGGNIVAVTSEPTAKGTGLDDSEDQNTQKLMQFFNSMAHLNGKDYQSKDVVFNVVVEAFDKLEERFRGEEGVRISEHTKLKSRHTNQAGRTETIIAGDQDAIDCLGKEGAKSKGQAVKFQRFTHSPDRSLTDQDKDSSSLRVDLAAEGETVTVISDKGKIDATAALSKAQMPLVQYVMKLHNIPMDKVTFDSTGNLIPHPDHFPGVSLQALDAVKDADEKTKSFMQALQVIQFIQGMEKQKHTSQAKQHAEQISIQALFEHFEDAASSFSKSSKEQKEQFGGLINRVQGQVMERFDFIEGVDFIVKDNKMHLLVKDNKNEVELQKDKGLDSKLKTNRRDYFANWETILYLTFIKRHSAEKATKMLEPTFQSNESQDNCIRTFVTEWFGKEKLKERPILDNASKQRAEAAKRKGTYLPNGSDLEDSSNVKSLFASLAQWVRGLLQISFGGYLAMFQHFGQLLKNFTPLSTQGATQAAKEGQEEHASNTEVLQDNSLR